jgi:hypothetical protein
MYHDYTFLDTNSIHIIRGKRVHGKRKNGHTVRGAVVHTIIAERINGHTNQKFGALTCENTKVIHGIRNRLIGKESERKK